MAAKRRLSGITGTGAVVGGAAWVTACVLHASQPSGCVGASCTDVPMRESTPATAGLLALAGVLLVASGSGLLVMIRQRGPLPRTAVVGAALATTGLVVLAGAVSVQALLFPDGDFDLMPFLVGPGVLLLAAGLAAVGWTVLRSGVLPRWAGASLLVGAVLILGSNEQTNAVLLAVPFGIAWIASGLALVARRSGPAAPA